MLTYIRDSNKFVLITIILLFLNFASGLTVIYVRHINRMSMAHLQKLVDEQDKLYQEWTQLLLEQSTLTSYNRVDQLVRKNLNMRLPNNNEISVIDLTE